jgi:hypothetical protein
MKFRMLCATVLSLAITPLIAHAQTSTTTPYAARRESAIERREAMRARREARTAMTPEQRKAAKAARRARYESLPADQQQYVRDQRTYQHGLRAKSRELQAQVSAGTMTRDAMARDLKVYRDSNRPSRPAGMPDKPRAP